MKFGFLQQLYFVHLELRKCTSKLILPKYFCLENFLPLFTGGVASKLKNYLMAPSSLCTLTIIGKSKLLHARQLFLCIQKDTIVYRVSRNQSIHSFKTETNFSQLDH